MKQGTTPTIPLTVDTDLTDWTVYVTFANGSHEVTVDNTRLEIEYDSENEQTDIEVALTQEETLSLPVGYADVQVRAIKDGIAIATDIQPIDVGRILKDGVIDELPQS